MASYRLSYDSYSVTFRVTGLTKGQYVELYLRLDDGNRAIVNQSYTASGSTLTKTFDDVLTPGERYAANVKVGANEDSATWIGKQTFDAPEEEIKPSVTSWSWNSSNGSATAAQTRTAYSSISGNGNEFSCLVWNDMVDKVMEILEASGDAWSNGYATYRQTLMSYSDKTLTADRFNSLRENIGIHVVTGIAPVSRGDVVYGWYFTRLADRMNEWISRL